MKTLRLNLGHLLKTNRWIQISELLLVFSPAFIMLPLIGTLSEEQLLTKMWIIWATNVCMMLLVGLGLWLRGDNPSSFGLTFSRPSLKQALKTLLLSLLVCALGAFAYLLGTGLMANISGMPESADMSNYDYFQNNLGLLVLTLAGVYLVSSFGEELIYRAFLINRLTALGLNGKAGQIVVIVLSAVVFGSVHFEWGLTGMVATGMMGLVMALFYVFLDKKLWVLVLAHAYLDTILLVPLFMGLN